MAGLNGSDCWERATAAVNEVRVWIIERNNLSTVLGIMKSTVVPQEFGGKQERIIGVASISFYSRHISVPLTGH